MATIARRQFVNVAGYRGKRALDVGLVVLSAPVTVLVGTVCAVLILVDAGLPILYAQDRVGLHGRSFTLLKFRSMVTGADASPFPDESKVTQSGRVLRRFSLDELPQLINVLRGDMSLVGPRPTLRYQVQRYNARQRGRLSARPGITGMAQVRGRNSMTWSDRIELDLEYCASPSLWVDCRILLTTLGVVLRGTGVHGHPEADPIAAASETCAD